MPYHKQLCSRPNDHRNVELNHIFVKCPHIHHLLGIWTVERGQFNEIAILRDSMRVYEVCAIILKTNKQTNCACE